MGLTYEEACAKLRNILRVYEFLVYSDLAEKYYERCVDDNGVAVRRNVGVGGRGDMFFCTYLNPKIMIDESYYNDTTAAYMIWNSVLPEYELVKSNGKTAFISDIPVIDNEESFFQQSLLEHNDLRLFEKFLFGTLKNMPVIQSFFFDLDYMKELLQIMEEENVQ